MRSSHFMMSPPRIGKRADFTAGDAVSRGRSAASAFGAVAATLVLAACGTPAQIAPGASEADVIARAGRPDAVHPLPGSARRYEYVIGRWQQQKYMVDLDASNRVSAVAQVLTWDNFMRLRAGIDTTETVLREFGVPYYKRHFALTNTTVWHYPYRESGAFDSEIGVYFDAKGVVRKVESGPDPRSLRDGEGRRN
jgi:hypothetical protein